MLLLKETALDAIAVAAAAVVLAVAAKTAAPLLPALLLLVVVVVLLVVCVVDGVVVVVDVVVPPSSFLRFSILLCDHPQIKGMLLLLLPLLHSLLLQHTATLGGLQIGPHRAWV